MPSFTWKTAGMAGIVALAAGGIGAGLQAGRQAVDAPKVLASTQTPEPTADPAPASELVEFRHEAAGFALSAPEAWARPGVSDPQVAFIAAEYDPAENRGGSILVRVAPLEAAVTRDQLAEARKVTDEIVRQGNGVELKAQPAEIEQGGVPGLYYLYTFEDPVSGRRGVHSHYFLFHGRAMISMVFQALPDGDFAGLAPLFDRVADSFRVLGPGS
ncbi:MAG: hypothetical protein ACRDYV_02790 [Acidimicrobiia bacterium]